jgi:protocatechuate 3,4-dioxygenase beta subunit
MMGNDDAGMGHVLTRREILALLGSTSFVVLTGSSGPLLDAAGIPGSSSAQAASALPACVVRPEQTEGPYFVDERLQRSDIRSDPSDGSVRAGALLHLTFQVSRVSGAGCTPLAGALVDIWHCDHAGVYSDVRDPRASTVGKKFLRGYQVTSSDGIARFTTIYPGWYQGRAVHIHFKIRPAPSAGRGFDFTSQLYFDDTFTDRVHAQQPYASRGQRTVRNSGDGLFRQGGAQLVLDVRPDGQNYAATFPVGLQTA